MVRKYNLNALYAIRISTFFIESNCGNGIGHVFVGNGKAQTLVCAFEVFRGLGVFILVMI